MRPTLGRVNATVARLRLRSVLAVAAGVLLASCSSSGSTASDATVASASACAEVPVVAAPTEHLPATTAVGEVTVHGKALTSTPDNGKADPEKGCAVPIVDGQAFDGTPVRIGGPTDKPTMVVAAAHWCPHCNRELPELVKLVNGGGVADRVRWVVLSTGVDSGSPHYPPGPWLTKDMGWTGTAMADDAKSDAGHALGVAGFPTFILINTEGKVVERFSGEAPNAEITKKLDAFFKTFDGTGTDTTPPRRSPTSAATS